MKRPTDTELSILNLLWMNGPMSVREVHELLSKKKNVFYTSTLKTMQVMLDKGYLDRDTSKRSHIYFAAVKQEEVQTSFLKKLTDLVFEGSTSQLIISALGNNPPSDEELQEIKSLLDKLEDDA